MVELDRIWPQGRPEGFASLTIRPEAHRDPRLQGQKGVLTIDAALGLFFSIALFYFILTTSFLVRTEVVLHTAATSAAKELSQYGYLIKKAKNLAGPELEAVLSNALDLLGKSSGAKQALDWDKADADFNQVLEDPNLAKENLRALVQDPAHYLTGLVKMKGNRLVTQAVVAQTLRHYIPGQNDLQKTIFLKRMGVLGGLEGLGFAGSRLYQKGQDWFLTLQLSCRIRGLYYKYLEHYHYIKESITVQIW